MATEQLQIVIDANYKGKAAVRQAGDDVENLGNKSQKTGDKMRSFATGIGTATIAIGAVGFAAKQAWEFIGEGAELELARSRFDNLTASIGSTSSAMIGELSAATNGMMSNAEMIDSASQIISLGLADNQEDVVNLASLVSELGWDMQQVIMTFANNSKMRLDALGLSVTDVEKRTERLVSEGHNLDRAFDLAVIEAGQAKLELLGSAADTTAGDMKRLESSIADAMNVLKEEAAGGTGPYIKALADSVNAQALMNQMMEDGTLTSEQYNRIMLDTFFSLDGNARQLEMLADIQAEHTAELDLSVKAAESFDRAMIQGGDATHEYSENVIEAIEQSGAYEVTTDDLTGAVIRQRDAQIQARQATLEAATAMRENFISAAKDSETAADDFREELINMYQALGSPEQLQKLVTAKAKLAEIEAAFIAGDLSAEQMRGQVLGLVADMATIESKEVYIDVITTYSAVGHIPEGAYTPDSFSQPSDTGGGGNLIPDTNSGGGGGIGGEAENRIINTVNVNVTGGRGAADTANMVAARVSDVLGNL